MKSFLRSITQLTFALGLLLASTALPARADLAPADKQFLAGYEQVRAALAADNLDSAKKSATALPESGGALASSKTLAEARAAFAKLSERAVKLAKGQKGYHIVYCSMANKQWVQTSSVVGNPFLGKEMAGCGEMKQ